MSRYLELVDEWHHKANQFRAFGDSSLISGADAYRSAANELEDLENRMQAKAKEAKESAAHSFMKMDFGEISPAFNSFIQSLEDLIK